MTVVSISDFQVGKTLPSGTPFTIVVTRERTDESRTVNRRHKPSGWIPPTAYFLNVLHRRGSLGSYGARTTFGTGFLYEGAVCGVDGSQWSVDYVANFSLQSVDSGNELNALLNSALIQARNNLKDMKVDLGTAFGERAQTARLIGDTATSLARAFTQLKRGNVRNAMHALGISGRRSEPRGSSIPKKWLELQYGWKPLLSDVWGAVDALSKRDRSDWRVTAKGRAQTKKDKTYSETGNNVSHFVSSTKGEFYAFVRIDAFLREVSSLTSLGVTNPLNVAWELVPYSFVVDWFLPVGNWISSLDATLGMDIQGCSQTQFKRLISTGQGFTHDFGGTRYTNEWTMLRKEVWLNRVVGLSVPRPSFPSLKDPVSLGHMANGLSLLAQAFGR